MVAEVGTAVRDHDCSPASLRVARRWKQHERPLTDKGISKTWSIHRVVQLHSLLLVLFSLQKGEILTHVPIGASLEDMMISEINQSQQDKFCKDST